jgi:hypothetical protein
MEANMRKMAFSVMISIIGIVAASAEVYAATCYKKVGGACVQSSTGSLNSSADCAVGWRRINGKSKLACLS